MIFKPSLIFFVGVTVLTATAMSHAYTSEEAIKDSSYDKNVSQEMRKLISKEQYKTIIKKLAPLKAPVTGKQLLGRADIFKVAASPCGPSLHYLALQYVTDKATQKALDSVNRGMQPLPIDYAMENPWAGHSSTAGLVRQIINDFTEWCVFLPEISGNQDNGLKYIQHFAWFYYRNQAGKDFVQGRDPNNLGVRLLTGLKFTRDFSGQRGKFMDSEASTQYVSQWANDPRIEIEDYISPKGGQYQSWNEFFARQIKIDEKNKTIPSRPVTMPLSEYPERDYIVVSPTDCIMNPLVQVLQKKGTEVRQYIANPLEEDMVLDVKNIPIGLMDLLGHVPKKLKDKFVGGTGLACVLMPNTYHHFHSPVNGEILHAEIVKTGTYGYPDFTNWAPKDGNVGRPGTDFSQFQQFQRGVVIIKVTYKNLEHKEVTGYVASIPVGLDTIGSVVLDKDVQVGKKVKRGYTRLGNFYYGGSLNILLFSEGLASGVVQTRLGTQITLFNIGKTPD